MKIYGSPYTYSFFQALKTKAWSLRELGMLNPWNDGKRWPLPSWLVARHYGE